MPFGARVVGRSVAALCLAASFVAAYSFAPEQQQQHHQQQQQQQGDAASNVIHPTVEIDAVWGCTGTSRTEAADCLEQSTITIRGRHFGRDSARAFLVPVHPQIPTSLNLEPIPCQRTQHSTLLPTLLLHCTLPAAAEGAAFHVRVVIHNGISAIKRNAVKYREKQSEAASGSDATDAKLRLMDPARWNELGVGGLGKQFKQLFRRAFGSRLTTVSDVAAELDVRHVKGVIFYGLPGTGKTLVARKVAEALGSTHVRVVNGPEILSKFVGESEKNLRELFSDAEAAWKEKGTKSDLYVIIIDEMDGIMRSRGDRSDDSAARAVYDSVTTQMLAYMDGVKTINNLLIIGLTNRLDALDPAMLRPGRFEVQIRFPLPDGEGRRQILDIHTKSLVAHKYLAPDVDLNAIAQATASFSGADLAATVRSATSYAFERIYETAPEGKPPTFAVTQADLQRGVTETLLAKSASANTEGHLRHGIVLYNDRIKQSYSRLKEFAAHVKASPTPIMSKVLLEGTSGSGLTAFAAFAAKQSHFPYVYIISPDAYVGMSSGEKMDRITQIFDSALQAPAACIVLDDIEALLEFSAAQSSVNANMQRDLARLLRRNPAFVTGGPGTLENEGRLLVIATSTSANSVRLLSSGRILFDAVEPILDLQSGDVAAVMTAYGVPAGEGLNQLVATLPPVVGIKRVVTWLQIAASQLKDKAASTGAIRPVSGDVSGLPKVSDAQSNVRIPVDLVAKTLREYGVVDQKPSEFDMTEDFNLF